MDQTLRFKLCLLAASIDRLEIRLGDDFIFQPTLKFQSINGNHQNLFCVNDENDTRRCKKPQITFKAVAEVVLG